MKEYFKLFQEMFKLDYKIQSFILFTLFFSLCCSLFIIMGEHPIWWILIVVPGIIFVSHFFIIYRPSYVKEQKAAKTFHLTFVEQNCWLRSTQQKDNTWSTQIYISFQAKNLTNDLLILSFYQIVKPKIGEAISHRLLIKHAQSNLYGNYDISPKRTQPGTLEIFVNGKYKKKNKKVFMKFSISESAENMQTVKLNLRNDND
jgi:Ca2+/Na+ antiporter